MTRELDLAAEPVDPDRILPAARWLDLGREDYRATYDRQLALVEQRKLEQGLDTLLMVEHPHVFTVGRSKKALANVLTPGDVDVVAIERGGDVTYHGPGQLVAYPVVRLSESERDLHRLLRNLEAGIIRTLARYGLEADRNPGNTGVWLGDRKIASIGIACRRWVSFHGLALNVSTDLGYFSRINPCGFEARVMTSMARELGHRRTIQNAESGPQGGQLDMAEVKRYLATDLGHTLNRNFILDSSQPVSP